MEATATMYANFCKAKDAVRKFKLGIETCTRDMTEVEDQVNAGKALQKTLGETFKSFDQ